MYSLINGVMRGRLVMKGNQKGLHVELLHRGEDWSMIKIIILIVMNHDWEEMK